MSISQPIYHLVPASYYQAQPVDQAYHPETFEAEGFIHCTAGSKMLLEVANIYFATLNEALLILEIEPQQLTAALKFEPPIHPTQQPFADEDSEPPEADILFPHIYGPLNRDAISVCFALQRDEAGLWQMPNEGAEL